MSNLTNESNSFENTVFGEQILALSNIKDFNNDLDQKIDDCKTLTQTLISAYEEGVSILNENADRDFKKEWDEKLNFIQVSTNKMNNTLEILRDNIYQQNNVDFSERLKEWDDQFLELEKQSLKFETFGIQHLPETFHEKWNTDIVVFEEKIKPRIESETKVIKLILRLFYRYKSDKLVSILEKINEDYQDEDVHTENEKKIPIQDRYTKAIKEFEKDLKPENLWDSFLEILAGGVTPSPSERVMLEKWMDGEEKTREDM